jgi:hypothetical protein
MAEFRSPVDIGNRALQHCGAERMGADGFSENSKRAQEVAFAYPKLREAELRRNVWTMACRRTMLRPIDDDTMLLDAAMWSETTTYFVGSIVADQYGNPWISKIPDNLNNDPLSTATPYWEPYFGPMTVALHDTGQSYFAGELVYTTPGDGTARIYLSLQSANEDTPGTATAYSATTVYSKNQVVTYSSVAYMSLINLNSGNTPSASPAAWAIGTTYGAGDAVAGSDGIKYTSIGAGNIGHDPTTDGGANWTNTGVLVPWTTVFVGGSGSIKWLQIGGAEFPGGVGLSTLDITYPLGTGPSSQSSSANIFKLPAGFLRFANQNPKQGATWLGSGNGVTYNDWVVENGWLLSAESGVIPLRFVANLTDVSRMDPMFCEGLAARVALEVCEPITQSTAKLATIAKVYDTFMTEARTVNAIEQGPDDPPQDDFLTVRY